MVYIHISVHISFACYDVTFPRLFPRLPILVVMFGSSLSVLSWKAMQMKVVCSRPHIMVAVFVHMCAE